jgi:uncharacterized protein (TIGR02246 family)
LLLSLTAYLEEETAMATTAMQKELVGLEKQYWQAIKDKDVDAALRLTDDPCFVTGPQGAASVDKKALAGMLNAASWTLHDFEVTDVQVRLLSNDVAILAYKVHEKLTVDGKPVTIDAADASTWVRRDGRWLCALHTESIAGDPFGRDQRT